MAQVRYLSTVSGVVWTLGPISDDVDGKDIRRRDMRYSPRVNGYGHQCPYQFSIVDVVNARWWCAKNNIEVELGPVNWLKSK